jgi:protein-L-isoaspartate O-methyltransferase
MNDGSPCSQAAFEARYRADPDPWDFVSSTYERARYAATLGALGRRCYGTAFEPGCSVGELTAALAPLCIRVLATDIAPSAVATARRRCAGLGNVEIECADISKDIPDTSLDLVVFSEIGYYFVADELARIAANIAARLVDGGEWVAVHWLGHSDDHEIHADTVHETLSAVLPLRWVRGARHEGFRIDSWVRR